MYSVCEISGELDSVQAKPMHESDSSHNLSPGVKSQTDSSLLAKSQQKADEMLTQLENETATTMQWEEISSAYTKETDNAVVQYISSIYHL